MATLPKIYSLRTFSLHDVAEELQMSAPSAAVALNRWKDQGLVKTVRRNLHVVVEPTTGSPVADKFEIATKIAEDSYVGWHSALEYHGLAHQAFYNIYVGSGKRFSKFNFEGTDYEYCSSPVPPTEENGIVTPAGNPYVRVSDIERTVIDCIDRIERAGGLEELLHCLEGLTYLNEEKFLKYLAAYNKAFLYQKAGFILENYPCGSGLGEEFFATCINKGAIHPKRLTNANDSDFFVSRWKLYVPSSITPQTSDHEFI